MNAREINAAYEAWSIVWEWPKLRGTPPHFAFKSTRGFLPFFTTRQDAAKFAREHKDGDGVRWHIVRVQVAATAVLHTDDSPID